MFNLKNGFFFIEANQELANLLTYCQASNKIKILKVEISRVREQTGFTIHENYIYGSTTIVTDSRM